MASSKCTLRPFSPLIYRSTLARAVCTLFMAHRRLGCCLNRCCCCCNYSKCLLLLAPHPPGARLAFRTDGFGQRFSNVFPPPSPNPLCLSNPHPPLAS